MNDRRVLKHLVMVYMVIFCMCLLHYFIGFKGIIQWFTVNVVDLNDITRIGRTGDCNQIGTLDESFTVIIPTEDNRIKSLMATVKQLININQINKILIIWNTVGKRPRFELRNLSVSFPVIIKEMPRNSLNNRFQDFKEVQTDCVLCMDDDIIVKPEDIISAFRMWQTDRSRLVGFYDRYHIWNNASKSWKYSWKVITGACKSMVLTKAMFYHKKYHSIYSSRSLQAMRSEIDRLVNCEDIAMNFVISNATRKRPVFMNKTFEEFCPLCKGLSKQSHHSEERTFCLNIFAKMFGYMPLLC